MNRADIVKRVTEILTNNNHSVVVGNSRTTLEEKYIDTNDPSRDYSVFSLKAIYK